MAREAKRRYLAWWRWVPVDGALQLGTAAFLIVVALVPVIGNELRVQDVDPIYMRNMIDRAAELGGTYYENAIHNRGPIEPMLYDLAGRVTSYDGYWYAISAMVAVIAAVVAYAGAVTARFTGANRSVALGVAGVVYVQLTLADHGYSRVLYIRNITTALLVLVWIVALSERLWMGPRRTRCSSIAIGALLGLVAEQLLTSVFAGAVVGLVALGLMYERRGREEGRGHERAAIIAAVVAFAAAPAWYLVRGQIDEYWSGWWVYARNMSVGTGRSLESQLTRGWDQAYAYHGRNPLLVALLVAFVGVTWLLWQDLDRRRRIVHAGLGAWYTAGWLELTLSQRYTPHYFAVIAMPTAFMGAALAGHAARLVAARKPAAPVSMAVPLVATALAIYLTGPSLFVESVEKTKDFDGISAAAAEREKQLGGADRSVRAVLDLVSPDHSALLAWTFDPFVYPRYHRVPATRFQWKALVLGEIYLGKTSPDYVLPRTWTWFTEDVEESDPVAFAETEPFSSGTPFEELIIEQYRQVYPGDAARVWLRRDAAAQLLEPSADRPWRDAGGRHAQSGWTISGTSASFAQGARGVADDALPLGAGPCLRVEGTLDTSAPGALIDVLFRFDSAEDPSEERQILALEGTRVGSGSTGLGPLGFEALDANLDGDGPVAFALVVGNRSAALVINGELQAAMRLPESVMQVTLESRTPELSVTGLMTGTAPTGGGCPGA